MAAPPPPIGVLTAFRADERPVRLSGGRGTAWRAGTVVVKPADTDEASLAWQAEHLGAIEHDGFRLALPLRSRLGTFVVDGWTASDFCAGRHEGRRWVDTIATGDRFHAAAARLACPRLPERTDPWSAADRVAWGEAPIVPYLGAPHIARLVDLFAPVEAPSQVIHGDLTGNVLFADDLPPAVIDVAVYCRPTRFATAVVLADALAWEGATVADLEPALGAEGVGQYLARALVFRIVTDWLVDPAAVRARAFAYGSGVDLAARLAR